MGGQRQEVEAPPRSDNSKKRETHCGRWGAGRRPKQESVSVNGLGLLGLGGVVDERGEEPGEALRGGDDARAEEGLVP